MATAPQTDSPAARKDRRGAKPGQTTMPQPHGGSIGQPAYEPTDEEREFVRENVFYMGQEACSRRLGINDRTLRKYYRREIDEATDAAQLELGQTAMQRAKAGDGAMLRFILATRFPQTWSPKLVHKHVGDVNVHHQFDLREFIAGKSDEQIEAFIELIDGLLAAGGVELAGGVDGSETPTLALPSGT